MVSTFSSYFLTLIPTKEYKYIKKIPVHTVSFVLEKKLQVYEMWTCHNGQWLCWYCVLERNINLLYWTTEKKEKATVLENTLM